MVDAQTWLNGLTINKNTIEEIFGTADGKKGSVKEVLTIYFERMKKC